MPPLTPSAAAAASSTARSLLALVESEVTVAHRWGPEVQDLGFRVYGLGFKVWGLGFRV